MKELQASVANTYLKGKEAGAKVISGKDFTLVYFITCFLPFVRPSVPNLKDTEIKKARKKPKAICKLFQFPKEEKPRAENGSDLISPIRSSRDYVIQVVQDQAPLLSDLGFLAQCKDTMMQLHGHREQLGFNGKSMYLKIHQDLQKKKQRRQESFNQSLWVAEQHQNKGINVFWP